MVRQQPIDHRYPPAQAPYHRFLILLRALMALVLVTAATVAVAGERALNLTGGDPWILMSAPQELRLDSGPAAALVRERAEDLQPRCLVEADLDHNGVPDLLVGYSDGGRGVLAYLRGDETRYPARESAPPFLPEPAAFQLPIVPDFLATGDLDGDSYHDVVVAARNGAALALLRGDGAGGLTPAELVALPGRVTAVAHGEVNRSDGLTDLVVAVADAGTFSVLVYEYPLGALRGEPEIFPLPAEGTDIVVGPLDGHFARDIAVATGNQVQIICGRDRRLSWDISVRDAVPEAVVDHLAFAAPVRALAVARLHQQSYRQLAVLTADGELTLVEGSEDGAWRRTAAPGWQSRAVGPDSDLVAARVSSLPNDDLMLLGADGATIWHRSGPVGGVAETAVVATLSCDHELRAVLPLRLNLDPLHDLVVVTGEVGSLQVLASAPAVTLPVNTNDDNTDCECTGVHCSLRDAICVANKESGLVTIEFEDGIGTIQPTAMLPTIIVPVLIDGAQYSGTTRTELLGNTMGGPYRCLEVKNSSTITSMEVRGCHGVGILLEGGPSYVESCNLGVAGAGNAQMAVKVMADDVVIGGSNPQRNVISANLESGVYIKECSGVTVSGNYIGIGADGSQELGNSDYGVFIYDASDIVIGTPTAPNVISANGQSGVWIGGSSSPPQIVRVMSNLIGLRADGISPLGNGASGILVTSGTANTIGGTVSSHRNVICDNDTAGIMLKSSSVTATSVQGNLVGWTLADTKESNWGEGISVIGADFNTVGGSLSGAGNFVTAGNLRSAIYLAGDAGDSPDGNFVQRNTVGLNRAGTAVGGYLGTGINVSGSNNTIGGIDDGNVVCNAVGSGIRVSGLESDFTTTGIAVQGNWVGLDADSTPWPNTTGINVEGSVTDITIGGSNAGEWNLIRNNLGSGIEVHDDSYGDFPTGVRIDLNSIGNNGGLAIDLWRSSTGEGVTPNDEGDGDIGPNGFQNYPHLGSFRPETHLLFMGLHSVPSTLFTIQVYASPTCDASGYGEAWYPMVETTMWTLSPGYGSHSVVVPEVPETWFFTAVAIDPNGNTSELSECLPAMALEIFADDFESGDTSAWSASAQ